jgi:hypothetical protein
MKVVDIFNTFLGNIYSLILVGQSGRYEFVKIAVRFCRNRWFSAESVLVRFREPLKQNLCRTPT